MQSLAQTLLIRVSELSELESGQAVGAPMQSTL